MKIVQGITFRDEHVSLDGKHFEDCIFIDCTLEYSGGDLSLERTSMHGCKHILRGYACQTAKYMRSIGLFDNAPGKWTEHTGKVN